MTDPLAKERTASPEAAHESLRIAWMDSEELTWFLGAAPKDFPRWTARKSGERYTFTPPDGSPGLEVDRQQLALVLERLWDRGWARTSSRTKPRRFARKRVPESAQSAFDELLKTRLWQEGEDRTRFFFHAVCRRAAVDAVLAADLADLAKQFEKAGACFLRVAEWICRNYRDVWLCAQFQMVLEQGRLGWRKGTSRKKYAKHIEALVKKESPLRKELKDSLRGALRELEELEREDTRLLKKFEERKEAIQRTVGGRIFGKTLGRETKRDSLQWEYFSRELFNVVSHLNGEGLPEGTSCKLAGRALFLLADEWFTEEDRDGMRKRPNALRERARWRYRWLRDKGETPKTPARLKKGPVWKDIVVRVSSSE